MVPYVHIQDSQLRIKDIYHEGEWHWGLLATSLPRDVRLKMSSHFVDGATEDAVIWGDSSSGIYTTKEAYNWLVYESLSQTDGEGPWNWVWHPKLPENIKHFLWIILHDSPPTNLFRLKRHVSLDASCPGCGASEESITYLLRNCSKVRDTWRHQKFDQKLNFFFQDCHDWNYNNTNGEQGHLFAVCCWMIWKRRNDVIFNGKNWSDWFLFNQIRTLDELVAQNFDAQKPPRPPKEVIWSPPAASCFKLNVDGSSLGNPWNSGFGGLIRDMYGHWLVGFSALYGYTTNLNVELMAVHQGLSLAWNKGYRCIICESDSATAVDLINQSAHSLHPYAPLINSTRYFWLYPWTLSFQHTFREGNACAD